MPVHSTLVTELNVPYTDKVSLKMSKVEREVDKLNRILEIERQRAEKIRAKQDKWE